MGESGGRNRVKVGKGKGRGNNGDDFEDGGSGTRSLTAGGKGLNPSSPLCSSPYRYEHVLLRRYFRVDWGCRPFV